MFGRKLGQAWAIARSLWDTKTARPDIDEALDSLRAKVPAPVIWLFGKTQTGKTSIIRYLTGAEDAAIGNGFKPCTRTSRMYHFPTDEAPLLTFLDTRGLDEAGYDPSEDITQFANLAHIVLVTVKLTDLAQGNIRAGLAKIRAADPGRKAILALTTLHEAYPGQQHPQPYPYSASRADVAASASIPPDVTSLLKEHESKFAGLCDATVLIDLTQPEEGYDDPYYGGEALKQTLRDHLPDAYRQSFMRMEESQILLKGLHLKQAGPLLLGYASLAATAGAIPIPFIDLLILPAIQSRMVYHLAKVYGQELSAVRFLELASSLGLGLLARQAIREAAKFIPFVGSAAGAALAGASTYALGRAFCMYYESMRAGHAPDANTLKRFYREQLEAAEQRWNPTRK